MHFSPTVITASPTDTDFALIFFGDTILLKQEGEQLWVPKIADISDTLLSHESWFCLGTTEEGNVFTFLTPPVAVDPLPSPLAFAPVRTFRTMEKEHSLLLTSALHLWRWYNEQRYCSKCGHLMKPDSQLRALRCSDCDRLCFPTISPAVIVAITDGDYILLAQNAAGYRNSPSLIAGYVEVGETLEEAVQREAMEEIGLSLTDLEYVTNQPWGFSGSMMFAFKARANRHEMLTLQESEIASAQWIHRNDLHIHPYPTSVAAKLITRFRNQTL